MVLRQGVDKRESVWRKAPGQGQPTTAEKLEGTSTGVDTDPLLFPPPSLPTPLLFRPCFYPLPSPFLFTQPPRSIQLEGLGNLLGCPRCPEKKNYSQFQTFEGTKYTWSPICPKLARTRPTGRVGCLRLWAPDRGKIYM